MKKETDSVFAKKAKVLFKLYNAGCKTEKDLQTLTMEAILKITDITISDIAVIIELQRNTKLNKLFSYLGGEADESNAEQTG